MHQSFALQPDTPGWLRYRLASHGVQAMPPPLPPWELLEAPPCELLETACELLEELLDEEELEELDDG